MRERACYGLFFLVDSFLCGLAFVILERKIGIWFDRSSVLLSAALLWIWFSFFACTSTFIHDGDGDEGMQCNYIEENK